jgi:hypothetical protein
VAEDESFISIMKLVQTQDCTHLMSSYMYP